MLRHALVPLSGQIGRAFVFGSIAKQQDTAGSDIDLLIVSETLGYGDLMAALEGTRQTLGRAINPVLYSEAEFQRRLQEDNAFFTRVMQQPTIWLIGQEEHAEHEHGLPTWEPERL